jgi:hypothetical protein
MVTDGYYSGVNAELVTVMAWRWYSGSSAGKPKYKFTQNFQDNWRSTNVEMEIAPWWYVSISPTKSTTHLLPGYEANYVWFLTGCNHGYIFCVTCCWRLNINLLGMIFPTRTICTLRYMKMHLK